MLVEEYLQTLQLERQKHLDLESDCVERGGNSTNHRGVLAEYLNTPIYGRPADLCHACHNHKCSNPKHLYWGTRSENVYDSVAAGTHFKVKVSSEEMRRRGSKGWSKGGKANKGKPKSEEHKRKISEALRKR